MSNDEELLADLLQQWEERTDQGTEISLALLCQNHPHLLPELEQRIAKLRALAWMAEYEASPRPFSPEVLPGYQLLSQIGKGGFGQVWKARGPEGRLVALKYVELSNAPGSEWQIFNEMKEFRHPNVLAVLDAIHTASSIVLVLELADCSLYDRLLECRNQGLPGIPAEELWNYMREAAAGLDALHAFGLAHRDVKPANLLLCGGVLKVADFGLAKILSGGPASHSGMMTPTFAAPEYFAGQTSHSGDQYGLAISYCQLRGGRLPFIGTPVEVMSGHLYRDPDLAMIPPSERPAVAKALAKKPGVRWISCSAFVASLCTGHPNWNDDDPTEAFPIPRQRWSSGSLGALWCLFIGIVLCGVVAYQQWASPPAEPSPPERLSVDVLQIDPIDLDRLPAFEFDGKSRIVTPVERFAPVTLECWARPELHLQGRTEKYLIGSDIPLKSGIGIGYNFFYRKPPPVLFVQLLPAPIGRDVDTYTPLEIGQWSHIAAVFGAKQTVVYLNGVEVARGPVTGQEGGTVFVVGNAGRDNPDHHYVGKMSSIRITRGERYSGNFKPAKELLADTNAVLVYTATQIEGNKAIDLCGQNHGLLQGVKVVRP